MINADRFFLDDKMPNQAFKNLCLEDRFAVQRSNSDWQAIADALNVKDKPIGWIYSRQLISILKQDVTNLGASLIWIWKHGVNVDKTDPDPILKCLVARLFFAMETPSADFKINVDELISGCTQINAPDSLKNSITSAQQLVSESFLACGSDCDAAMVEGACIG